MVAIGVVKMGAAEVMAAVMAQAVTMAVAAVAGWLWWRCRLPPPRRDDPSSAVGGAPVKYYN